MSLFKNYRWKLLWLLLPLALGGFLLAWVYIASQESERRTLPDLRQITDVQERKQMFIGFLLPAIEQRNQEIADQRALLLGLEAQYRQSESLNARETTQLSELARRMRVDMQPEQASFWQTMQRRLDQLPPSLVLAQAANESGWGTSRFAREGNNFFGQWCFVEGCGIVPKRRPEGANHEVAAFDSPRQAIVSYFRNLNTHNAYSELRAMREQARERGGMLSGEALAEGLQRYSERGEAYVEELREMIRYNDFERFDRHLDASTASETLAAE
jgi:Bax protein